VAASNSLDERPPPIKPTPRRPQSPIVPPQANIFRGAQEIYLAIWSKAVYTQMRFNEMSVKSRQFGLGFVAAALGLGIALLTRHEDFSIPVPLLGGFSLHATVLVTLASSAALYAVKRLE
jgi:hypothetical protein